MVRNVIAGIVVADIEKARLWYADVFGRDPDAAPMEGLYEWRFGDHCVQVVELDTVRRIQGLPQWGTGGASSITLVVEHAQDAAYAAVASGGKNVSHYGGPAFQTCSVCDPEGNLVTFLAYGAGSGTQEAPESPS
jgi:catechol 2,3-dioxygenase-like lactoylglutathione lyase family enzyme